MIDKLLKLTKKEPEQKQDAQPKKAEKWRATTEERKEMEDLMLQERGVRRLLDHLIIRQGVLSQEKAAWWLKFMGKRGIKGELQFNSDTGIVTRMNIDHLD